MIHKLFDQPIEEGKLLHGASAIHNFLETPIAGSIPFEETRVAFFIGDDGQEKGVLFRDGVVQPRPTLETAKWRMVGREAVSKS